MKIYFVIILLLSMGAYGKSPALYSKDSNFIDGYDPVNYLTIQKATKGKTNYSLDYKGVKILFSSLENKQMFEQNPQKYLPVFAGYCAYAMAKDGSLVEVDPMSFKIINGKTYLFYNGFFADTLKKWNEESFKASEQSLIQAANKNWGHLIE